jgi:hypothetical protein
LCRWFSRSFKSFSLPYTIINFLFAFLKLLTNFENAYYNSPQTSLVCDWSMFSSADLSLDAGKMPKINLVTGGFMIFEGRLDCEQRTLPKYVNKQASI